MVTTHHPRPIVPASSVSPQRSRHSPASFSAAVASVYPLILAHHVLAVYSQLAAAAATQRTLTTAVPPPSQIYPPLDFTLSCYPVRCRRCLLQHQLPLEIEREIIHLRPRPPHANLAGEGKKWEGSDREPPEVKARWAGRRVKWNGGGVGSRNYKRNGRKKFRRWNGHYSERPSVLSTKLGWAVGPARGTAYSYLPNGGDLTLKEPSTDRQKIQAKNL
ncbi:hypothetical protein R3P38DRAFT_2793156 [Favolaschia claudopus]|uniref:Uncharacterized protein n=1 Tax=Favolaschia claudopus TaxID=2862362 RepID=A0AAW0AD72_9AGAR